MGFLGAIAMHKIKNMMGGQGGGGGGGKQKMAIPNWHQQSLQSYDQGTDYVPQSGPANLQQGEAVIPADQNAKRLAMMQFQKLMQSQQGQMPRMPQAPQPQPQLGGNNAMLPTGTATPRVAGIQPSATPATLQQRDASAGFKGLPAMIMQTKQKHAMDRMQQARQLAGQYIAMTNSGDPKLQQAAQQLVGDKKNHKIFDKAVNDPASPEYQGVQMAYRDVMEQDQQKQQFEMLKQQIASQQALNQQRQAYANKASEYGQVTQEDEFKQAQLNQRASEQISGRLQMQQNNLAALRSRLTERLAASQKITTMLEQGRNQRASASEAGKNTRQQQRQQQQGQAVKAITTQMKAIQGELSAKERDLKDTLADASKVESWVSGDRDALQMRAAGLQQDIQDLTTRFDQLDMQWTAMVNSGGIQTPQATPPGGSGPTIHDFTK